jgi:tetratricopeptide (TPR) repeat protein
MEKFKLVYVDVTWLSRERDKYVWEDRYMRPWDEIIGRIYLLKAHDEIEDRNYATALEDFEQALILFSKDKVRQDYYYHALADKSLVQSFLAQYEAALSTLDQACTTPDESDRTTMLSNRGAMLVLAGKFSDALNVIQAQLAQDMQDSNLRFTLATCLLHMERYNEAVVAYEQAIADARYVHDDRGLMAARQRRQPDWVDL